MGMNDSVIYNGIIFRTGDKVTCLISNHYEINDAKIYVASEEESIKKIGRNFRYAYNRLIYVCQNMCAGSSSPEYLKYSHSWAGIIIPGKPDQIDLGIYDLKRVTYNIFEDVLNDSIKIPAH